MICITYSYIINIINYYYELVVSHTEIKSHGLNMPTIEIKEGGIASVNFTVSVAENSGVSLSMLSWLFRQLVVHEI